MFFLISCLRVAIIFDTNDEIKNVLCALIMHTNALNHYQSESDIFNSYFIITNFFMFTDKLSERRPQAYKSTIQRTHRGIRTAATANCNHAGKEGIWWV